MTATQAPSGETAGKQPPGRRTTRAEIASAIDLGWRVAALYALSPTTLKPASPHVGDMLLNRRSMSASDRAELEVRAIAGVAERAGVALPAPEFERLLALAAVSGVSDEQEQAFRDEVARQHLEFEKKLWATDEPSGKAYELGNFLSDTWNRVVTPRVHGDPYSELAEIFGAVRVQRMKLLIDDLQARMDPVAAHTVETHLGTWRDRLKATPPRPATPAAANPGRDELALRFEPVERQTIIWRQMLTGDKEPEAYLDQKARASVRDEFSRQLLKRFGRPLALIVPLVIALATVAILWYVRNEDTAQAAATTVVAATAALGIRQATVIGAARKGVEDWGDLMWNRALAAVICRETSTLEDLYAGAAKPAPKRG